MRAIVFNILMDIVIGHVWIDQLTVRFFLSLSNQKSSLSAIMQMEMVVHS